MYKSQIKAILSLDVESRALFKGVYAIDELPNRASHGAYVVNYDEHDKPGSHWVAIYVQNGSVEYFDSYGQPPLDKRLKTFVGENFTYNPFQLQQALGNACGFYCTYYILKRSRKSTTYDILSLLTRTNSDYIVKNYLYRYYSIVFR